MEHAVEVLQWFIQVVRSSWTLAPLSLGCLALLWWQRQRSTAIILRTTAIVSHATGVPLLHRARPQLGQQLAHARRYERPLTAVVWSLEKEALTGCHTQWPPMGDSSSLASQQHSGPTTLFSFFLVGSILRAAMRESDIITYDVIHDQYVVLSPELTKPQALQAVRRLSELLYRRTRLRMRAGIAAFPGDGLTIEVLINNARTASTQQLIDEATSDATGQPSRQRPGGVPLVQAPLVHAPLVHAPLVQALDSTWAERRGE